MKCFKKVLKVFYMSAMFCGNSNINKSYIDITVRNKYSITNTQSQEVM